MNLGHSFKLSFRHLRRKPAFAAIIVFTFAIATSASIVIYGYVDALLLTELPFKDPESLVRIHAVKGGEKGLFSYPEFLDMQKQLSTIDALAVYRDGGRYNLSGDGKPPEDLTTTFASSNLFKVLGVTPMIGTHWPETLDKRGSHTIMLTYDFWKRRFDGNENTEMLPVTLDGFTYTNYGVLPEGFSFPTRNEAFRAMAFADFVVDSRDYRPCIGLARLLPGVTLQEFNAELEEFAQLQQELHMETNLGISYIAEPLSDFYIGDLYGYILLLALAAIFLLTIATVNVGNLITNRAIRRSKQTTLLKVLGSSRSSLITESVIYSMILSFLGSAFGLLIAWSIIQTSRELVDPFLPHWINLDINLYVILYAVGIALMLGMATGILPWLFQNVGSNMVNRLKEGQQMTGSSRQHSLQKWLASMQILVSAVLMIGGMLLYKSFISASEAELGYSTENKLTFRIALSWFKYGSAEKKSAFFENSLQQIAAIPGVESVTLNSILPLTDMVNTSAQSQENFLIEGQSNVQQSYNPFISVQRVVPNYFEAMDINLLTGQTFDSNDHPAHDRQVLIDKHLADKMWPDGNALGQRIKIGGEELDRPFLTIIGIVDNVKHQSVTGDNIPNVYLSFFAYPHTDAHYVVQSSRPLSELEPKLTETILSIDKNQPTFEYKYFKDVVAMKNWQAKVAGTLFLTIALIGSVIAAVGLFSMMTFILILKVKELALRRVLGASDINVLNIVLKEMLKMSGIGILGGLILSPLLLSPISPYLFEVHIVDIPVYAMVIAGLISISLLATLLPFRNALVVNPAKVLKGD